MPLGNQSIDFAPAATPDLSASPTTPGTRLESPLTPTSYSHDFLPVIAEDHDTREVRTTDPTSIFVGGLESSSEVWDEGRIRELFEKFGLVEDVQLIRPGKFRSNSSDDE